MSIQSGKRFKERICLPPTPFLSQIRAYTVCHTIRLTHCKTNLFHFGTIKVADLNFGCATFCALPSFDAVTTFSSHTTFFSHKVNVKGSDIDMCSAIYFLFDHNTKYCTIYLCPHTVLATVWLSPRRLGNRTRLYAVTFVGSTIARSH